MSIPDYQSVMLPLLELAGDEQERTLREAIEFLAARFGLTDQERKMLLPSDQQRIFDNRVSWARTYMKKAGLIESPRRGYFRITPRGLEVLKANPTKIDVSFLERFPEFVEFRSRRRENGRDPYRPGRRGSENSRRITGESLPRPSSGVGERVVGVCEKVFTPVF